MSVLKLSDELDFKINESKNLGGCKEIVALDNNGNECIVQKAKHFGTYYTVMDIDRKLILEDVSDTYDIAEYLLGLRCN